MTLKELHRNQPLFSVLSTAKPRLRRAILSNANTDFIKVISELCLNLTAGNIEMPDAVRKHTCKHRKIVRALAKKHNAKIKRKKLVQAGGNFFSLLLPIVSGLLSAAL